MGDEKRDDGVCAHEIDDRRVYQFAQGELMALGMASHLGIVRCAHEALAGLMLTARLVQDQMQKCGMPDDEMRRIREAVDRVVSRVYAEETAQPDLRFVVREDGEV